MGREVGGGGYRGVALGGGGLCRLSFLLMQGEAARPRVTFRRVAVPLRGPGQSPVPFACCVGSLRFVGRCGRCSCWCRFPVRGAQSLVCRGCAGCGGCHLCPPRMCASYNNNREVLPTDIDSTGDKEEVKMHVHGDGEKICTELGLEKVKSPSPGSDHGAREPVGCTQIQSPSQTNHCCLANGG